MLDRIGSLYRLNRKRLERWDEQLSLAEQSAEFQAAQQRLEAACMELFAHAEQEVRALKAAEGETLFARTDPRLASLGARADLEVFLTRPFVPLDNNPVERALRRPVVGRKLSYGSHSQDGAKLQGFLLSVFGTLALANIDLPRWLAAFLGACARLKPHTAVEDPAAWLPWGMPAEQRQALQQPATAREGGPAP